MATPLRLTALYEDVDNGWVQARVRELPAVITAAPTRAEARGQLEDAVREYLLAVIGSESVERPEGSGDREDLAVTIGD